MINDLLNDWKQSMTGTEQYHAQAIDILEDRIAKLEDKHRIASKQNEVLMNLLSKLIKRDKDE